MRAQERNEAGQFPRTRWSLLIQLRNGGAEEDSALAELCQRYWYPVYGFLRRTERTREDAEDLTQGFFMTLISKQTLRAASQERGLLRSFLLGALKHYLADQARAATAAKRGGGCLPLPLEWLLAEERYALEPRDLRTPEFLYERAWAQEVLARCLQRLRAGLAASGRADTFAALEPFISGDEDVGSYQELANRLQTSEASLRVLVHRLRRRLRDLLVEEVAVTADSTAEIEVELAWLRSTLGRCN